MSNFTLPTEIVELPSKGLLYPEENILSSGKIEMKYNLCFYYNLMRHLSL